MRKQNEVCRVSVKDMKGRGWVLDVRDEKDGQDVAEMFAHWPVPALQAMSAGVGSLLAMTSQERDELASRTTAELDDESIRQDEEFYASVGM